MRKLLIIAKYTFYEALKSRLLANVIFLGAAIILSSYVASEFTYGRPDKVALDIGLGLTSIVLKIIAVFYGVGIIQQEIENRSIYLVLSRPVRRTEYFLGRVVGMSLLLLVNVISLTPFSLLSFKILGGEIEPLMWWTLFYMYIEAIILLLVVVVLSLISSKVISILVAISIYISGFVTEALLESNSFAQKGAFNLLLKAANLTLPNFSRFNLKDLVLYETSIPNDFLIKTMIYAVLYILALVGIGSALMNRKSLD